MDNVNAISISKGAENGIEKTKIRKNKEVQGNKIKSMNNLTFTTNKSIT